MTTSESSICLFHNQRYSSNIQCILNLVRKNKISIKCDLNIIGKRSLCICKLSSDQLIVNNEEYNKKQEEFQKLRKYQWIEEINKIIQYKIMNKCSCQISIYKLFKFICDISNEKIFLKIIKSIQKDIKGKTIKLNRPSIFLHRQIQLSILPNQIGHLIGRNGHFHKKIMNNTNTKIHFDNLPYSISTKSNTSTNFNLDLFQSSDPIIVTITGDTNESIENAINAIEKLQHNLQG